jgi:hypothetical protein
VLVARQIKIAIGLARSRIRTAFGYFLLRPFVSRALLFAH